MNPCWPPFGHIKCKFVRISQNTFHCKHFCDLLTAQRQLRQLLRRHQSSFHWRRSLRHARKGQHFVTSARQRFRLMTRGGAAEQPIALAAIKNAFLGHVNSEAVH